MRKVVRLFNKNYDMEFNPHYSKYLENLFSERTFNYRKSIVITSFLLILIQLLDIVPTEITTFGISLSETNQEQLLSILFFANLYFIISFAIFALIDFSKQRINTSTSMLKYYLAQLNWIRERKKHIDSLNENLNELRDIDEIEKDVEKFKKLINEVDQLQSESHYSSELESKWDELKELRKKLDKYLGKKSENEKVAKDIKKLFGATSTQYKYIKKFEDDFLIKHVNKLNIVSWIYFIAIPILLFGYSTYLVFK